MRLTMTLLVKNEAEIIADNLKVHSQLGVDNFIVMDNGSKDGTRELLDELKKKYEITIIDRAVTDYQQSNWRTEMARLARRKYGAQWVISNDADEFWIPKQGDLKSELTSTGSIIYCQRFNMLFDRESFDHGGKYYEQNNRVRYPIHYPRGIVLTEDNMSIMLGRINCKVMLRTLGLLRVKGGNHRAWHLWGKWNETTSRNVQVYHFPIRSKEHFLRNIENRKVLLDKGVTRMGLHYKRWVRMLEQGTLDQEIERQVVDRNYQHVLRNLGVLVEDNTPAERIKPLLGKS
jgi:glycosyltransferase involved in cell wall biosynthesis